MNIKTKEGPSEVIIPEQRYISCYGCKWFNHQLVRSGKYPIYRYSCICPPNDKEYSITLGIKGKLIANMGDTIETPEWCPVLKSNVYEK